MIIKIYERDNSGSPSGWYCADSENWSDGTLKVESAGFSDREVLAGFTESRFYMWGVIGKKGVKR